MLPLRLFFLPAAVILLLATFTVTTYAIGTSACLLLHRTLIVPAASVHYCGQVTVGIYMDHNTDKNSMGNDTGSVLYDKIWGSLHTRCPDTEANNCQRFYPITFPSQKIFLNNTFAGKFTLVVSSQDGANDSRLDVNLGYRY